MNDDLVKRLRDLGDHAAFEPHMYHTAADRIEALERERDALFRKAALAEEWRDSDRERAEAAEAALATAREALSLIAVMGRSDDPAVAANIARMAVEQATAAVALIDGGRNG